MDVMVGVLESVTEGREYQGRRPIELQMKRETSNGAKYFVRVTAGDGSRSHFERAVGKLVVIRYQLYEGVSQKTGQRYVSRYDAYLLGVDDAQKMVESARSVSAQPVAVGAR